MLAYDALKHVIPMQLVETGDIYSPRQFRHFFCMRINEYLLANAVFGVDRPSATCLHTTKFYGRQWRFVFGFGLF